MFNLEAIEKLNILRNICGVDMGKCGIQQMKQCKQ